MDRKKMAAELRELADQIEGSGKAPAGAAAAAFNLSSVASILEKLTTLLPMIISMIRTQTP